MAGIKKAANLYDGRSQRCGKCPLWTFPKSRCSMEIHDVCTNAFVEGFKKGVNWSKEQFKKEIIGNKFDNPELLRNKKE